LAGLAPSIARDAAVGFFALFQTTACLAMGGSSPPMTCRDVIAGWSP